MEKISRKDRVRNEVVLLGGKEERKILHKMKRKKANWIGHVVRRNCLLKHVIQGKTPDVLLRQYKVHTQETMDQNCGNINENTDFFKLPN